MLPKPPPPDTYRNQDPPVETSAARVEALNEESEEIAIYLIRRHTGLTNGEIGKIFKMKAQAVSKAGIKIERLVKENGKISNQVNK